MIIDSTDTQFESNHTIEESIIFWEKLESIVQVNDANNNNAKVLGNDNGNTESNKIDSNTALVNFLKLSTDAYRDYINTDSDVYRVGLTLIGSKLWHNDKNFCMGKLLSMLSIDMLEINMKFIVSYILLFECKKNLKSLDVILDYQGFKVFYNTLYTQFAYLSKYGEENNIYNKNKNDSTINLNRFNGSNFTDMDLIIIDEIKQICTVLMDILFQIFKYCKCTINDLLLVDDFFVHFLICSIRSDTIDDMFNNTEFKLLLSLNEQYMMFKKEYNIENKVFKYLVNDDNFISNKFIELLFLQFNRTRDTSLQIMMCKILYSILTQCSRQFIESFFYLNDLNVFVDVLIRELQDISEQREVLRNTLLRVLIPLLKNTELCQTNYRKMDLMELLNYLSDYNNLCSTDTVTTEQLTTVKLAFKCLNEVEWLSKSNVDDENETTNGRLNFLNDDTSSLTSSRTSRQSSMVAMTVSYDNDMDTSDIYLPMKNVVSNQFSANYSSDSSSISLNENTMKPKIPPKVTPRKMYSNKSPNSNVNSTDTLNKKKKPPAPPSRKICNSGSTSNTCDNSSSNNSNDCSRSNVPSYLVGVPPGPN